MPLQGAEQQIDQQKAALLNVIAQQGTQGKVAFDAEAARRQAQQQAAQGAILARSNGMTGSAGNAPQALTQQLQADQGALGSIYAQDAAMSQQGFQNSIAQTSAANDAYMQQAKAGVPLIRAQTEGTMAQIRAEMEQKRLDREEAAKERAFADEQRQYEREQRDADTIDEESGQKLEDIDKWNEALAQRQDGVLRDVNREMPEGVAALISDAVELSDNVPDAMAYVNRKLSEFYQAGEQIPGYGKNSRQDIARKVYQFYTLKKPPSDPAELDQALQSEGISLSDVDPRYKPPARKDGSFLGVNTRTGRKGGDKAKGGKKDPGTKWDEAPAAVAERYLQDFEQYAQRHSDMSDSELVKSYRAARKRLGKWYPTDQAS